MGDKPVAFSDGSWLDTSLQALTVTSLEVRLPIGVGEKIEIKVEVSNGRVYAGQMTSKMPRDTGGRNQPTFHIYEFTSESPLEPLS